MKASLSEGRDWGKLLCQEALGVDRKGATLHFASSAKCCFVRNDDVVDERRYLKGFVKKLLAEDRDRKEPLRQEVFTRS